ncbi:MAG: molybdopterin-dependent oxidoreductase [Candidatus Manganitrophus sp. SB1]|nr:molybdopterin-dependent oxidoreductase [Candidatus Manganitrophus morganii]
MSDETKAKIELPTAPEPEAAPAKKMLDVTIDGKKLSVPEGSLLLDTIRGLGMEIPAMCYHYTFSSFGSCGVCLVEVEGKNNNVRSCTAKITQGMVVKTNTEKIVDARKKAIEKHLIVHPLDCPVCDADGKCELQDMAYDLGVYDIKKGTRKEIPEDTRSLVLDFNMNRCILCGQCINVCKEVQLVDALCFYKKDGKTHVGAHDGVPLYCEFCGDCLAVCPVGAIVSRFSKYSFKPWQLKKTVTTCGYCSDGCTLHLESEAQKVVRVTSKLSYLSKFGQEVELGDDHGGTCVRGRFGFQYTQNESRLSRPLMKTDGQWSEVPWFKATAMIGKRLMEIKTQHGGEAIAGLITGRCTNEDVYLFQRLMRSVLGTNNIDTAARYGHMNSVTALQKTIGIGQATTSDKAMTLSDVILVIGNDMTETNPVTALRLKEAKARFAAKLMVAHNFQTNLMALASHSLQYTVGGETALIQGLVKSILDKGLAFPAFVEKYPAAYEALRQSVAGLSEENLARESGLPWEKIAEAAELLAKSKRGTLIWGEGIVSKKEGYHNALRLIDLALLTGLLEKEGAGILPICEENNEQGAVDMGAVPEFLPGQRPYASEADRERFRSAWHTELPEGIGATLPEILERAERGEIKALYLVGENPLGTLPNAMRVRQALENVDFIVCQDPFMTETGEMADFVLPAAVAAEKEGTFTDVEGKIRRVAQAFDPRGEARPDWKIFCDLAKGMNHPLQYKGPEDIAQEIAKLVPGYFRDERPAPRPERYSDGAFIAEIAGRYRATERKKEAAFPFSLELIQVLYHSGKLSTRDPGLMKIEDRAVLYIGAADAEAMGLKTADTVKIKSSLGQVEVPVEVLESLPKGVVHFPNHFNRPNVKDLLTGTIDPATHVPYFKQGEVALEKVWKIQLTVMPAEPAAEETK